MTILSKLKLSYPLGQIVMPIFDKKSELAQLAESILTGIDLKFLRHRGDHGPEDIFQNHFLEVFVPSVHVLKSRSDKVRKYQCFVVRTRACSRL